MATDFYEVLGVPTDASHRDIRRAYRDKVKEYHPDVNNHPRAHAQFKVLKKARDVLLDHAERKAYDRLGHDLYVEKRLHGDLPTTDVPWVQSRADEASVGPNVASTGYGNRSRNVGRTNGGNVRGHGRPGTSGRISRSRSRSGLSRRRFVVDRFIPHLWLIITGTLVGYFLGLMGILSTRSHLIELEALFSVFGMISESPQTAMEVMVTERFGVPILSTLGEPLVRGTLTLEGLILLGIVVGLPISLCICVTLLRRRTVWQASWVYVIGGLTPSVGIVLNVVGVTALPLDILLFVIIPAGTGIVFLVNRFR